MHLEHLGNLEYVSLTSPSKAQASTIRWGHRTRNFGGANISSGGCDTRAEVFQILIRGGSIGPMNSFGDQEHPGDGGVSLFAHPQKIQVTMSRPPDNFGPESTPNWHPKSTGNGHYHQGYTKGKTPSFSRHTSSAQEDDISWDPEMDKDDQGLTVPRIERKRYARDEQRTIVAKNLSDRTTHKDIVDFVRGGPVLDIYLRSNERSASISFVEGSAAQEFMNHVKRNDVYIHGKRVCSFSIGEGRVPLTFSHSWNSRGMIANLSYLVTWPTRSELVQLGIW